VSLGGCNNLKECKIISLFTTEKAFFRKLLLIAVPIALQNLIMFGVSMADTVMIGMLGETQLSAVALANQLGFIYSLFTFGVAGGANVLIAQYWGRGDTESIRKVMAIIYRILLVGGLIFTGLALFCSEQVMGIFSTDPEVISQGALFLRTVGPSYLPMGISSVTIIMLRSVRAVKISLVVYIISLITNCVLNWALIFGNLGMPRLEVEGAAIATFASRVVEIAVVLFYILKVDKRINFKIRHLFIRKPGILQSLARNAGPVMLNELFWGSGAATLNIIIGRMGTDFTAANSICSVLSQLVTITIFGAASSASTIVGNAIGEGDYERAKRYGNILLLTSVVLGLGSSAIAQLMKYPMMSLYNVSDTVVELTRQIINVYSFVVIVMSVSAMAIVGVLRGGGDTRFALFLDVTFMWVVCIPFGFFAAFKLGLSAPVVYLIIKCDEFFKAGIAIYRILSGKWINDITRPGGAPALDEPLPEAGEA
jgi:putative MATE family efflux protein